MSDMNNITKKSAIVKTVNAGSRDPIREMKQMIDIETKKRKMLTEYIEKHLKNGIDYGTIHIVKWCKLPDCTDKKHLSKPSLFKPGSEKFNSLLHITPRFKKDVDTWEMLGSQPGTICYICELVDNHGTIVGEGRGVCTLTQRSDPNAAVKIAEKRSQIDAVLRTGGLSDFFTQDLEDMSFDDDKGKKSQPQDEKKPAPAQAPVKKDNTITQEKTRKINDIWQLTQKKGIAIPDIAAKYKVESLYQLDDATLNAIHRRLVITPDKAKGDTDPDMPPLENAQDIDPEIVDKGIKAMKEKE